VVGAHHTDADNSNPHAHVDSPLRPVRSTTLQAAGDSKRMVNGAIATARGIVSSQGTGQRVADRDVSPLQLHGVVMKKGLQIKVNRAFAHSPVYHLGRAGR